MANQYFRIAFLLSLFLSLSYQSIRIEARVGKGCIGKCYRSPTPSPSMIDSEEQANKEQINLKRLTVSPIASASVKLTPPYASPSVRLTGTTPNASPSVRLSPPNPSPSVRLAGTPNPSPSVSLTPPNPSPSVRLAGTTPNGSPSLTPPNPSPSVVSPNASPSFHT
ncbi:unnamed protein product [Arabidopsis lyrata]|uniref:Predicted protein n=1 Tax=Arabidopsis lyrata subsp. lyrata TaxID=81972 RepID=D7KK93_ARALL|nr:predicted protein [Arabidopsis lyrata subsp. lyrata]CAH8254110.1 unnamed protein product [Arabidopsis lyrata]